MIIFNNSLHKFSKYYDRSECLQITHLWVKCDICRRRSLVLIHKYAMHECCRKFMKLEDCKHIAVLVA